MVAATRTFNPLHFEDLEPKRFEDLIRQLVYDFKLWRRLEATGRAGSDDGFDARGYEIVEAEPPAASEIDDDEAVVVGAGDRLWLVQCKRERALGPTKLLRYLDEIRLADGEALHGIIFAAACDFSKTARDRFRDKCAALGLQEWHLWGKAEIEDRLYRPENDGLLFAYFGVSLTIRRRSQRTELRAKLSMKRKAKRLLGPRESNSVLLRSPDASEYPNDERTPDFETRPLWLVRRYLGLGLNGLEFLMQRHFAYLADDDKSWDAMFRWDDAINLSDDSWRKPVKVPDTQRSDAYGIWMEIPERNRAWFEVVGIVPFENVLDIDEIGDDWFDGPHVYAPFADRGGPFRHFYGRVETATMFQRRCAYLQDELTDRIERFPVLFRVRQPTPSADLPASEVGTGIGDDEATPDPIP
jgi:hypothetical protein